MCLPDSVVMTKIETTIETYNSEKLTPPQKTFCRRNKIN